MINKRIIGKKLRKYKFYLIIFCLTIIYKIQCSFNYDQHKLQLDKCKKQVKEIQLEKDLFDEHKIIGQNDSSLVEYIRKYHLIPPPSTVLSPNYLTSNPSEFPEILNTLFADKFGGFFIECGASDGVFLSNTLKLERAQQWTGLLIEADSINFPKLVSKKRNAWLSNACLSKDRPKKMEWMHHIGRRKHNIGNNRLKILGESETDTNYRANRDGSMINMINLGFVECFPLYSILLAIPVLEIDYFSLDIEGFEFEVVKGIPFDLVKIKVFSIEYWLIPEGKQVLIDFMDEKNYEVKFTTNQELFFVLKES